MNVPFVDLKAQYLSLKDEIDAAISGVISETAFISGRYASVFENTFAEYLGVDNCIACANGTDAIEIALKAVGVKPGDEVIVPANTWISTAEAVTTIGATPVFCDSDSRTYNIDPARIEEKITSKTTAIIPVHLYGLPAEMISIMQIARDHGLKVIEDCAQSHGASSHGQRVGSFGDAATFSFYPSKNLGAFGDAGGIVTNDSDVADAARLIANHGQIAKNRHSIEGRNSRLDGIQAAVLSVKLPHLESWIESRRSHASLYNELLAATGIVMPIEPDGLRHTYHLYVVRVTDRDAVQARLAGAGIETGVHYPTALPFMEAYADRGWTPADFPVAYAQMGELLSLPMYAELTDEMIAVVCRELRMAVRLRASA